jgi:formiminotetrahydrofolate cyclodeaminase
MSLSQIPVIDLLSAFRSPEPTPGGGSAAALAGAVGSSLLAMVAALARTGAQTDEELRTLRAAGEQCASFANRLAALMDEDTEAYDAVVASFKLPKTTDAERSARTIRIQEALRRATEAPLEVMRACRGALEHAPVVAQFGNANARSDVQVGVELLGAALRGAKLNVEINLESLKDAAYVEAVRREAERLSGSGGRSAPSASS